VNEKEKKREKEFFLWLSCRFERFFHVILYVKEEIESVIKIKVLKEY
jgi:hypothetical protein